jgi:hypothetical protein
MGRFINSNTPIDDEDDLDGHIFAEPPSSSAVRKQRLLSNASSSMRLDQLPPRTDDVITFSLTNTFSTIQSLKDELAAIRQSLDNDQ